MKGLLPPSSSESFLPEPAVALRMMRPTSVDPVNAILSTSGWSDERAPRLAVPVHDVDDAGRQARLMGDLGERHRRERRELGGLEDQRVAARQRRRDLPREHQQREIPRE
jgi:hypothetical protein